MFFSKNKILGPLLTFSKSKVLCCIDPRLTEYTETKAGRKNLPAEEGITGSDAAGRAKRVSSEKQTEYDLSRNTSRLKE